VPSCFLVEADVWGWWWWWWWWWWWCV